jgi:DNA-binding MarR family transcriptional regulator
MLALDDVDLPLSITTQEIARLCRELEAIVERKAVQPQAAIIASAHAPSESDLIVLAKSLIKERAMRYCHLSGMDLGEPVWDILLDLYVSDATGRRVSVSSACIASNVPPTTGLRYVSSLTSKGDILRVLDETDARRVFVKLSDEVTEAIRGYLCCVFESRSASREAGEAPSQCGR